MGIQHGIVVPLAHATGWTAQIPVGMVVLAGAAYLWTARRPRRPSPTMP